MVTYTVPRVGGRGSQDKLARQCQATKPIVHLRQVVRASSEDRGRSAEMPGRAISTGSRATRNFAMSTHSRASFGQKKLGICAAIPDDP